MFSIPLKGGAKRKRSVPRLGDNGDAYETFEAYILLVGNVVIVPTICINTLLVFVVTN